jgi:hypothetical protein
LRITKSEFKHLASHIRSKSSRDVGPGLRFAIAHLDPKGSHRDLQSLGAADINRLIEILPHGRGTSMTSPVLTKIKKKARTSLLGLQTPHLDPESWPQIYRMQMRLNNSRGGIKAGPLGQFYKLNPKGMSLRSPLQGQSTWTTSDGGDLHIMGPWSDITRMLGACSARFEVDMGDMYDGDVNVEFDRMYGSPTGDSPDWYEKISAMPLYVTLTDGAAFAKTDSEGEVVLNAPGEIVNLVGSKITAIAGAAGPASLGNNVLDGIAEAKGTLEDHIIPAFEKGRELYDMRREDRLNKTLCTLTIGIGPMGRNYAVGKQSMSAAEVLTLARKLR